MAPRMSPDGFLYRFDIGAAPGDRLTRKRHHEQRWAQGFDIQHMSAAELRFVAAGIDEARSQTK